MQALGKRVLEIGGYTPLLAASGIEAIRMVTEHQPALVMMDMALPDIDGLETTRRIKKDHPELPIIAVSAHAFVRDAERAKEAGCDAYISKPYRIGEFTALIAEVLARRD